MNKRRLLKLADGLDALKYRKNDREHGYHQEHFTHSCGTPACALGHWAAWNPRRWGFNESNWPFLKGSLDEDLYAAMKEFDIGFVEASELFSDIGCGNAKTAKQAAKYIRKFVERNS